MKTSLLLACAATMSILAVLMSIMGPTALPVSALPNVWIGLALLFGAVVLLSRLPSALAGPLAVAIVATTAIELAAGLTPIQIPVAFVASYVLAWLLRERLAQISLVFAGVLLASTAFRYPAALGYAPESQVKHHFAAAPKPTVVHILLDEMVGLGGIDQSLPEGAALHVKMGALFQRHGFRLHEKAFSRHYMSEKSIPNALNFNDSDDDVGNTSVMRQPRQTTKFNTLKLFEQFKAAGYRLHIFQTAHFDFCSNNPVTSCSTLASFNPFNRYVDPRFDRDFMLASLIAKQFQHSWIGSEYAHALVTRSKRLPYASPAAHFEIPAFVKWFDHFTDVVTASQGGDYLFGHFLAPHAPYFLDASCLSKGEWNAGYAMIENKAISVAGFADLRRHLLRLYYGQASCVLDRVERLLDKMAALPRFADATILIHGDHGSRISSARFAEHVTPRDMVENYATLFAVRRPTVAAGVDHRKVSLQTLIKEYFSSRADGRPIILPTVAVEADGGKGVVVRPMPDF